MQFDLRAIDPPGNWGGVALFVLVCLGALVGLICLLIRCIKRTVGLVDLAVWLVGLGLGIALGVVRDDRLTVGGFLLIFACMAAGLFVSFRRDKELALQGDRMLESASVAAVATFAGNWLL